uniref:Maternal effect embryo arrest 59 n=1 Tax=Davidia involucrata TaxID=16924 RepID=A0A5B6Z3T7_DAVIN
MVGQSTVTKPSRSDEVLNADQQLRITNQVRNQFDSMAPKRPTKPNRSESDSPPKTPLLNEDIPVPEFERFRSLQSQSHAIFSGANNMIQDEFVETQYYKQLDFIDKQHHTTGNGFIKVGSEGFQDGYDLRLQTGNENGGHREMVFRTNPATNDWIPNVEDDQVVYVSSKPNRSESC